MLEFLRLEEIYVKIDSLWRVFKILPRSSSISLSISPWISSLPTTLDIGNDSLTKKLRVDPPPFKKHRLSKSWRGNGPSCECPQSITSTTIQSETITGYSTKFILNDQMSDEIISLHQASFPKNYRKNNSCIFLFNISYFSPVLLLCFKQWSFQLG